MNPTFSADVQAFQKEFATFLRELVPADWAGAGTLPREEYDAFAEKIRGQLYERGYIGVSWPQEYGGRGLSAEYQVAIAEELTRQGLPQGIASDVFGIQMFGSTLLAFGTEEQKQRFLPRILSGEDKWCQGYSEPQSGSDLASASTTAVLEDGMWRINGQKIWTSTAHLADWIFVLVRTDPDAAKHRGLTLLACPMDQPGIEVRQIQQISGEADFNEVFFTDAMTPEENTIGSVSDGWRVATALLEHERGGAAAVLAIRFAEELDRLEELARERGRHHEQDIRRRIAWCRSRVFAMRLMGYRALTRTLSGEGIGPEGAMNKLFWSEYHRVLTELSMDILGEDVLTLRGRRPAIPDGPDAPGAPTDSAGWITTFLNARSSTIFAGTSQVQRNLLAEKILGMPREPRAESSRGR
ncbi:acyl-CoA dehydrogenase [Aeromicrobium phragmitis]|uniref:Acyl-CoA dehydrogenase n=1 Tax=Aeromicrobium phragmitis TaxID=2478914 RepID=A0A3L8PKV0_9ACTN|nr:acyl-CoA dehydrogenase family protein [Aeromicrobium phragmitis]RLV55343.1 acyl-CoA dehydrogenase [Aeromicrobium phragmitis]